MKINKMTKKSKGKKMEVEDVENKEFNEENNTNASFFSDTSHNMIQVDIGGHPPLPTGSHTIFILAVCF
jgi:hypothetical protein